MSKIERIKELTALLNRASDAYYNTGNTIMEDREFDALMEELRGLEQETGFIMAMSPTQNVGYEVKSQLEKVRHNHPMLSLDKTKSLEDILKFIDDKVFVAMPKMDGLTCSIRYLDGQLVSAETRGNGEIGESVLHCAKVIKNLPLRIDYKNELVIDGEVIIADGDFQAINAKLPEDQRYKNSRNLVSGSIRQLDSKIAAQRDMRFIAWKCITPIHIENTYEDNNSFCWRLQQLEQLGFEVVSYGYGGMCNLKTMRQYRNENAIVILEDIVKWIKNWAMKKGYPLDGCVFGYDDIAYGEALGATEHHLRSQIAFKFYDELYPTKLQYIDWTIGKTGILTPTAVFDPIEIDGCVIERASLSNVSVMKQTLGDKPFIGQAIKVTKRNCIVPKIEMAQNELGEWAYGSNS